MVNILLLQYDVVKLNTFAVRQVHYLCYAIVAVVFVAVVAAAAAVAVHC